MRSCLELVIFSILSISLSRTNFRDPNVRISNNHLAVFRMMAHLGQQYAVGFDPCARVQPSMILPLGRLSASCSDRILRLPTHQELDQLRTRPPTLIERKPPALDHNRSITSLLLSHPIRASDYSGPKDVTTSTSPPTASLRRYLS